MEGAGVEGAGRPRVVPELERIRAAELTALEVRVLAHHFYDGASQQLVAAQLGIHQSNVSRLLARVRGKLARAGLPMPVRRTARKGRVRSMAGDVMNRLAAGSGGAFRFIDSR